MHRYWGDTHTDLGSRPEMHSEDGSSDTKVMERVLWWDRPQPRTPEEEERRQGGVLGKARRGRGGGMKGGIESPTEKCLFMKRGTVGIMTNNFGVQQ